jgi:hypothetical protein
VLAGREHATNCRNVAPLLRQPWRSQPRWRPFGDAMRATRVMCCLLNFLVWGSCTSEPTPRHAFERFLYQDKSGHWTFDNTGEVGEECLRLVVMCNQLRREMQEEELIGTDLFAVIGDPKVSYTRLLKALLRLGPVTEEPTFWTRIANDPTYDERHRALCIYELFKRQIRTGMTLGEVADIVNASGKPTWLTERKWWFSALWRGTGQALLPPSMGMQRYVFEFSPVTMVRVSGPRLHSEVAVHVLLAVDEPVETEAFARLLCYNEAQEPLLSSVFHKKPLRMTQVSAADVCPPQLVEGELLIERVRARGVDPQDEVVFGLLESFVFVHEWPEPVPNEAEGGPGASFSTRSK